MQKYIFLVNFVTLKSANFAPMSEKEYKFNPQTLAYEPVECPPRLRRYRTARRVLLLFIAAATLNLVVSMTYYTPKLSRLEQRGEQLTKEFEVLGERIAASDYKIDHVRSAWMALDAQSRLLYRQSRSLDELQIFSKDKEKMAASIPAIWPINKKDLRGPIGAYGRRLHPIYKRYIQHKGIDFGGRKGDPIYATGNGVVVHSEKGLRRKGYGQMLVIDHGFGYKTRYAHLSERIAKVGQEVKRGELIGYMGSTGGSTGPHLHYEVIYMGQNVDPINYFRRDMSEAELDRIIEQAKTTTFETLEGTANE